MNKSKNMNGSNYQNWASKWTRRPLQGGNEGGGSRRGSGLIKYTLLLLVSVFVAMALDDDIERILFSEDQITHDFTTNAVSSTPPVVVVGVATGAFRFLADLVRKIKLPLNVDFVRAESYGSETVSNGAPRISFDLKIDIQGKHVILVEDIVDTGNTLSCLIALLKSRGVSSVSVCTLLDKPARRKVNFELVGKGKYYCGFEQFMRNVSERGEVGILYRCSTSISRLKHRNANQGLRYVASTRNGMDPSIVPQGLMAPMMPLPFDVSGMSTTPVDVHRPGPVPMSTLASAMPENQSMMLGEQLFPLVERVEPDHAGKVTGILLEMDQTEVLHLIEAPDALKKKVSKALDVLHLASSGPNVGDQIGSLSLNQ
ncbi:unnamed protein product [Camellia sinensis]